VIDFKLIFTPECLSPKTNPNQKYYEVNIVDFRVLFIVSTVQRGYHGSIKNSDLGIINL